MANHGKKILIWVAMLILISACVLPSSVGAPVVPTIDPGAVNTYIAQTANAAATQTVRALPTSTATATFTPTPRNTNTASPTPTNTVIFLLKSPTPIIPPTLPGSGGNSSGFACEILSQYPGFGTNFSPRTNFDATWTVKNTGSKKWDRNSIDFVYSSGDKIHKVSGYDLSKDVNVGQTITFSVSMQAPKTPANYTTYWTLDTGSSTFCRMTVNINVN